MTSELTAQEEAWASKLYNAPTAPQQQKAPQKATGASPRPAPLYNHPTAGQEPAAPQEPQEVSEEDAFDDTQDAAADENVLEEIGLTAETIDKIEKAINDADHQQREEWRQQSYKTIHQVDIQFAQQLASEFSPELREILNETGYGNHPVILRELARISKALQRVRTTR